VGTFYELIKIAGLEKNRHPGEPRIGSGAGTGVQVFCKSMNKLENASPDEEVSGCEVRIRCEMDSEAAEACIVSRCRHVSHVGVATAELLQHFERELSR